MRTVDAIERDARDALERRDWTSARDLLAGCDGPPAQEMLAIAQRQLGDFDAALQHREAAVHGFQDAGDPVGAARAAMWLGYDRAHLRNEVAVAHAWFERAGRLLDGVATCREHGLLAYCRGKVALLFGEGPVAARPQGARVQAVARELGDDALESLGLALEGIALVRGGEVGDGMRLLDRATAVAITGRPAAAEFTGTICCALIGACEQVQDVERAARWCATLSDWVQANPNDELFGYCRLGYSWVLVASGRLEEAERELATALEAFDRGAPALRHDGTLRLAMVRLLQGRDDEAALLCDKADWHPRSLVCRAELALARGDVDDAASLVAQYRRWCQEAASFCDPVGLELVVRIAIARGAPAEAAGAVAELERISGLADTHSLRGTARLAAGMLAAATGRDDQAERDIEDALRLFLASGAPIEVAKARIELSALLARRGRTDRAERELDAARQALEAAGAEGLVRALDAGTAAKGGRGILSAREAEVLRLAAAGQSDAEIAGSLVLSEHTVHRHMANIRGKLDQRTRAAAVARATRDGLI